MIELAITEIAGHLTFTADTVTAWYWLPEVRWAFRPDAEREALLAAISEQYAGLAGFRLHLRRTTRPFPAEEWARTIDTHTPNPLPPVPGSPDWGDHLVAAQRHLLSVNHAEGQTYLGVTFARRSLGEHDRPLHGVVVHRRGGRGLRCRRRRGTRRGSRRRHASGTAAHGLERTVQSAAAGKQAGAGGAAGRSVSSAMRLSAAWRETAPSVAAGVVSPTS